MVILLHQVETVETNVDIGAGAGHWARTSGPGHHLPGGPRGVIGGSRRIVWICKKKQSRISTLSYHYDDNYNDNLN